MKETRLAFIKCCCGWEMTNGGSGTSDVEGGGGAYRYTSLPSEVAAGAAGTMDETQTQHTPMYTFGGRQAFKPGFYSSSWGREYLNTKVEREFDTINRNSIGRNGSATITGSDGTEYIRFDEATASTDMGAAHYANIFVSPYFSKDGTPITALSGTVNACCRCNIGGLLFTYNLFQFIYQLMMYSNIMYTCGEYHRELYNNATAATAAANTTAMTTMTGWLC